MDKNELLLSIGFSKEYISFLNKLDENGPSIAEYESGDECQFMPNDINNVIVDAPVTGFVTKVIVQQG